MCVCVCACICVCACVHAWLEFTDFVLVFGYVDISKITQFTKSPTETSVGESVQSMVMLSPCVYSGTSPILDTNLGRNMSFLVRCPHLRG